MTQIQNITQRKLAEEDIKEREEYLRLILNKYWIAFSFKSPE